MPPRRTDLDRGRLARVLRRVGEEVVQDWTNRHRLREYRQRARLDAPRIQQAVEHAVHVIGLLVNDAQGRKESDCLFLTVLLKTSPKGGQRLVRGFKRLLDIRIGMGRRHEIGLEL